ncbi:HEAT repeat domain-containing protein [Polyangium sp. y55x31]|uniref:HEAT repeat domain-containing protein n=1 Tax=Polyangium sp. y55x31 TaxID=3042688 RepID=UPI0024829830|nr:HEAT repeat domain-containing protein [Polyangium sp. y55x31]MDI1483592.1 HEAT repeat domain-containing protein [Polyangium sp. y55x31]
MKRRKLLLVPLFAVLAGLPLAYRAFTRNGEPSAESTLAAAPPVGTRVIYSIDWSSETDMDVPRVGGSQAGEAGTTPVSVHLHLKGALALRRAQTGEGGDVLCARFPEIEEHRALVFGNDVLAGDREIRDAFTAREGCFEFDDRGRVRRFLFEQDAPVLFQQFVQGVVEAMQYTSPPPKAEQWEGEEISTLGITRTHYAFEDGREDAITWNRNEYRELRGLPPWARDADPEIDGQGSITLDGQPGLKALSAEETIVVAGEQDTEPYRYHGKLALVRRTVEQDQGGPRVAEGLRSRPIGIPAGVAEAERAAQASEAARTNLGEVQSLIATYGGAPLAPGQMSAMVSFLHENDSACAEVGRMLERADLEPAQRTLAIDALVAAGTPAAQEALRAALSSPAARADGALLFSGLRRMAMLRTPTPETAAFLESAIDDARERGAPDARNAATVSLGAVAGQLLASEDGAGAGEAALSRLHEELSAAEDATGRAAVLIALGNTHDPEQAPVIQQYASDERAEVRIGAARALANIKSEEATGALLSLSADRETSVASMALRGLKDRVLGDGQRAELEHMVRSGSMSRDADAALMPVIARQVDADPAATRRMLEALLARHDEDGELALALRRMLGALDAARVAVAP